MWSTIKLHSRHMLSIYTKYKECGKKKNLKLVYGTRATADDN